MKKALIIHGYPQEVTPEHPVYKYFYSKGYKVFAPKLFLSSEEFNIESALETIKKEIRQNTPDAILGFSLGGLILPHLAVDYPDAKLFFVSTGTRFSPANLFYKIGISIMATSAIFPVMWLARSLPDFILMAIYRIFNPCGKEDDKEWYVQDKKANFSSLRKIPIEKQRQIMKTISCADNSKILKKIKNRSVTILTGENDVLMPARESERIKELLPQAILIKVKKSHFGVIDSRSLSMLDRYL